MPIVPPIILFSAGVDKGADSIFFFFALGENGYIAQKVASVSAYMCSNSEDIVTSDSTDLK